MSGRFHSRRRTNRLDGQIVWTPDKSSQTDKSSGRTNRLNGQIWTNKSSQMDKTSQCENGTNKVSDDEFVLLWPFSHQKTNKSSGGRTNRLTVWSTNVNTRGPTPLISRQISHKPWPLLLVPFHQGAGKSTIRLSVNLGGTLVDLFVWTDKSSSKKSSSKMDKQTVKFRGPNFCSSRFHIRRFVNLRRFVRPDDDCVNGQLQACFPQTIAPFASSIPPRRANRPFVPPIPSECESRSDFTRLVRLDGRTNRRTNSEDSSV